MIKNIILIINNRYKIIILFNKICRFSKRFNFLKIKYFLFINKNLL